MARTNDETEARRIARARRAKMQAARVQRDERIDDGVAKAVLSAKEVERAKIELSQAETVFAAAIAEHEQRLGRIVAAFKGEKLDANSIAELLELTPREVRRLGKLADKPTHHPDDAAAPKPPPTEEQNGHGDA
ncbi:hypothetical protein [Demequina lutea]|uniref:Multidrug resistance efflux pump n=1 Tax=Demequina lutea TaxID=431489 RepID=A0A7Y9ZCF0_9MICO|nr:hypothetical protein [Demequina lutea]NYI42862.1 multidrug resistance efflux pump [Demequina lutea]